MAFFIVRHQAENNSSSVGYRCPGLQCCHPAKNM